MHWSTPGSPPTVAQLRRTAQTLFHALRVAFEVDVGAPVLLEAPEELTSPAPMDDRATAIMAMHCARRLHAVGEARAPIDRDEAVAVLGMLDVLLRWLLRNCDEESRAIEDLRAAHLDVRDAGLLMTITAVLDGTRPGRQ
jgi:hypothetical protein